MKRNDERKDGKTMKENEKKTMKEKVKGTMKERREKL